MSPLLSLCALFILSAVAHAGSCTYQLDLTWEIGSPDGVDRYMIFVNGQSPGPALNINQGDEVEILVKNDLPFATTVHYHGIQQEGTPWSDGVPGVSQRPIPAGGSFTYKWTATQYGTYWYHSHSRGQIMDGFYGPIHIKPSPNVPNPFSAISNNPADITALQKASEDPTLVTITDWNHFTSDELRDIATSANIDTLCMDSILINGKGAVNCQTAAFIAALVPPPIIQLLGGQTYSDKGCAPLESTIFQTNTTHFFDLVPDSLFGNCTATNSPMEVISADPSAGWISLNFISTSAVDELTVSVDGHQMWVYAVDGLYTKPQLVEAITFPHGSRYAAAIKLDQTPGDYPIRVASSGLNQKVSGYATLSYTNGRGKPITVAPYINYGGVNTTANVTFMNTALAAPYNPEPPSQTVDVTHHLSLNRIAEAWVWALNGSSFGVPLEIVTPLLFDPSSALPGLTISTTNGSWVDIVLQMEGLQPSHPIHKHGNKGYIIGAGVGPFNWSTVADAIKEVPALFNLVNPPSVDTVYTPPTLGTGSWLVLRYQVVNPGAFLIHCHINPHLEGGMAMAILDGLDSWPTIPAEYVEAEESATGKSWVRSSIMAY